MSDTSYQPNSPSAVAAPRPEAPQISYSVLTVSALGFALWGLGWFVLIPNRTSQVGWALEFIGPLLIAISIVMYERVLSPRIGRPAVLLASAGALIGAVSTSIFALNPNNLTTTAGRMSRVSWNFGGDPVEL